MPSDTTNSDSSPQPSGKGSGREVLDLLGEKKPRRRRAAEPVTPPAAGPVKEPAEPTVADRKAEALDLLEEEANRERKRKEAHKNPPLQEKAGATILPPISRIQAEQERRMQAPREEEEPPQEMEEGPDGEKIIHLKPPILVKDLADRLGIKPHRLIAELLEWNVFASATAALEPDIVAKICERHGFVFERVKREAGAGVHKQEEVIAEPLPPDKAEEEDQLQARAPIITLMGHVDHGKTSLLDAIRRSKIASGEAGGITQHIAAYSVPVGEGKVTFIDTPGHAAFTEMRARGANVTDIVVLVIAADDGVMPQTLEAYNHAKAAGVAVMVALNKCDLASANIDRVKSQLQEMGLTPEDWGGETICVEVSATKGIGIDTLLEMMALQAEVLELRANPKGPARATVVEASYREGRGPTATVIVQTGALEVGQPFICGPCWGKIKSLIDDLGSPVKSAGPSTPVELLGFDELPNVGDEVVQMESERAAKRLSEERQLELRQTKLRAQGKPRLERMLESMHGAGKPVIKVVLKADVQGSVEAIAAALQDIRSEKIDLDIIHAGAGAVSESDILLASASEAVIIGFNVKVESSAVKVAKREQVQVKLFSIIYELVDQVRVAMLGMLEPEHREIMVGHARVKQVFKLSRGMVAGCVVIDGRILRSARARVLRGDQPVYDGGFATLRRFTEDVSEVRNGLECGIRLGDFSEYQEDDIIECYQLERMEQSL
ncbi:MAG TPA: translation initiation factor IF-2 [Verrucomicrobiales bacterium]|nr:translation initiation factor IF-2 [Verrucomicrobiales bacterium]